jgi:hypothetical protein
VVRSHLGPVHEGQGGARDALASASDALVSTRDAASQSLADRRQALVERKQALEQFVLSSLESAEELARAARSGQRDLAVEG